MGRNRKDRKPPKDGMNKCIKRCKKDIDSRLAQKFREIISPRGKGSRSSIRDHFSDFGVNLIKSLRLPHLKNRVSKWRALKSKMERRFKGYCIPKFLKIYRANMAIATLRCAYNFDTCTRKP